ncbi:MAG: hypothetical protein AOA66_0169 [Candidatus Bathyarchaeota archaeon BA2]|nr:MAG: hypothetical protein AOA66_0169 [Candidatus Bathyarchaeota archaeon BA2]
MSEEKPIGLAIAEKFFGLILVLIGAITAYITYNNPPGDIVAPFSSIFIAGSFIIIAIGTLLILAKAE